MISCINLVVRKTFGDGPVVALNAHGDVVAPGEGWSVDPYAAVVKDGVMYGRGAAVSKSDFVTYTRSEEHTSELPSLMRISYAVFCLKKKKTCTTYMYVTTRHGRC